jgi:hypothetical protein
MAADALGLLVACTWLVTAAAATVTAVVVHELAHLVTARFLGMEAKVCAGGHG